MAVPCRRILKIPIAFGSMIENRQTVNSINKNLQTFSRNVHGCGYLAAKVSFKLSDIGEGIREVVVKEWYVKVGDKVEQFDNICEVQSDKASVTITSRYDGIISKLYHEVDDVALVGKPLVDIETEDNDISSSSSDDEISHVSSPDPALKDEQPESKKEKEVKQEGTQKDTPILCIPSVRRMAKEHNIDLTLVNGSGKNGRILKEDLLKFLQKEPAPKTVLPEDRVEPVKGFQKAMVKTMTESLKVPTFVYGDEIKVSKLSEIRRSLKVLPELQEVKITFMPFFIKAVSNALHRYPILNSSLDETCENITYHKSHNIGVAVDTKIGLAVPVVKNVERLSIVDIARELDRLLEDGRKGSFAPNDLQGGTFAISNIGAIGGTYMKPIPLPPQVAIIALGASQLLPRFDENKNVVAEEIMSLSAAADHRIIDGATVARFTQFLKKQIENPYLLFLNI